MRRSLLTFCLCIVLMSCGVSDTTTNPIVIEPTTTTAPDPAASPSAAPARSTPADAPAATPAATDTTGAPPENAPAAAIDPATLRVDVELVADGFELPLYATGAGDGSQRLFVVGQRGTVEIVRDGQRLERPFLDITGIVGSSANEQGLLSIAFHPDYATNGQFFVNYTNLDGDTVIARYRVANDPDVADPASAEVLLTIDQPAANHNGGLVKFGPDGYLYIGTGDGGRAGDPWGNAQNRGVLLGKLLRIDVDGGTPYGIPRDNPFVDQPEMRPEIWAWGLRNPWRFSFDRATDDLYIADVGQNMYEEVNFQPAGSPGGENYGWNIMEGTSCYQTISCDTSNLVLPLVVYPHGQAGCSITGGYVYRGTTFPELAGVYFYADYCSGKIWALHNDADEEWRNAEVLDTRLSISSFGEDEAGELYLTDSFGGGLYRLVSSGG